ncbi:hypothetical protein FB567DRAFT_97399 [Paraphoma chrysanthemicola]|uniref:Fungal N-terminal domain-containing protein n=1 Tax=Paraphoma chrysanthemicola TaxID=798071 RepID=A0A8K0R148_9PLEO|nr:hypothetical protein FB567DRAFT_97399 [Paraphoma chrysanthemicola]
MSGAFETAAGAFAVVGVADVLIRAGREIIAFLNDVKDAPEDVSRLCQTIEDTIGLANSLKRCVDDLKTRGASFATTDTFTALESATKSSNRELQTLKVAAAKFKATKKTWSSVKYALGKDKVAKTTQKLEHLKALLVGCLTQAYGYVIDRYVMLLCASATSVVLTLSLSELSADDHVNIETALRTGFDEVVTQISSSSQDVQTKFDGLQQSVVLVGNVRHQELMIQTRQQMEGLKSTIDGNQNTLVARHDSQEISLSAIQSSQSTLLNRQTRVATRASKQTASILRTVERGNRRAARDSNTQLGKLEDVVTEVKHVRQLLSRDNGGAARTPRSNRSISFLGENRDDILILLLSLRKEFPSGLDTLVAQRGKDVSISDVRTLQVEFQALINSALQEGAASCTGSTATSTDRWFYPEDTVGYLRDSDTKQTSIRSSPSSFPEGSEEGDNQVTRLSKAHQNSTRKWTVHVPSSEARIILPRSSSKRKPARYTEEAGFSARVTQGQERFEICARFVRDMMYKRCLRQYTQLNVFIEVDNDISNFYHDLFEIGTIEDIDFALRQSTISPFYLDSYGDNLCLYYSTYYDRVDILDYLESQGVGQSALNHDTSIVSICWIFSTWEHLSPLNPMIIPKLATRAADPAAFVSTIAVFEVMRLSFNPNDERRSGKLLSSCLNVLQQYGYSAPTWDSHRLNNNVSESHVDLIRFLFATGAALEVTSGGGNYLLVWLKNARTLRLADEIRFANILDVLIEHGVDTGSRDYEWMTPSTYARVYKVWPQWCKALENNGKRIEDILELEGNTWLLQEDWKEVWKRVNYPNYPGYRYLEYELSHSDEDSEYGSDWTTDEESDEYSDGNSASAMDIAEDITGGNDNSVGVEGSTTGEDAAGNYDGPIVN